MSVRKLLDALPLIWACELGAKDEVLWLSSAALNANGCRLDDVVGQRASDIWPEADVHADVRATVRRQGGEQRVRTSFTLLNGRTVWLDSTIQAREHGHLMIAAVEVSALVDATRNLAALGAMTASGIDAEVDPAIARAVRSGLDIPGIVRETARDPVYVVSQLGLIVSSRAALRSAVRAAR